MSVISNSSDASRLLFDQRDAALRLFGQDAAATRLSQNAPRPNTPPEYARLVYHDWAQTFHAAVQREMEGSELVDDARAEKRLLNAEEVEHLRSADPPFRLSINMNAALGRAFNAFNGATTTRNSAGVTILTSDRCSSFWEQMSTYTINMVAVRAIVTAGERWDAFFSGLQDGANNVADAVGRTAANVMKSAGEALGAGAGGFLDSLGAINAILVVGVGYAILRFT
jgi:hypothetical protein